MMKSEEWGPHKPRTKETHTSKLEEGPWFHPTMLHDTYRWPYEPRALIARPSLTGPAPHRHPPQPPVFAPGSRRTFPSFSLRIGIVRFQKRTNLILFPILLSPCILVSCQSQFH